MIVTCGGHRVTGDHRVSRQPRRKRKDSKAAIAAAAAQAKAPSDGASPASSSSNSNSLTLTSSTAYQFLPTPYGAPAQQPPANYMTPPTTRFDSFTPGQQQTSGIFLKCSQCSEAFVNEEQRVQHVQHRHAVNGHMCQSCGGRFRCASAVCLIQ